MGKVQGKRNLGIEFWRFVFICCIACLHWSNNYFGAVPRFEAAYVATEFFFIVSGYLLVNKFYNGSEKISAWKYTFNRIKGMYFYYVCAFGVLFLYSCLEGRYLVTDIINELFGGIWELTFLHISGMRAYGLLNYPTWYISAMIIAGYFIYAGLRHFEEKYVEIIAPLSVILIYAVFSRENQTIDVWGGSSILNISDALTRAFAGMNLGILAFFLSRAIRDKYIENSMGKTVLSIIEILAFVGALNIMITRQHGQSDFFAIAFLFVGISIAFSGISTFDKIFDIEIFNIKIFEVAGRLSFIMFLNQIFIINIVGKIQGMSYKVAIIVYLVALTIFSMVFLLVADAIKRVVMSRIIAKK